MAVGVISGHEREEWGKGCDVFSVHLVVTARGGCEPVGVYQEAKVVVELPGGAHVVVGGEFTGFVSPFQACPQDPQAYRVSEGTQACAECC